MPKIPKQTGGVDFKKLAKSMRDRREEEALRQAQRVKFLKSLPKATNWKQHKANWSSCQLCDLCNRRSNVVLTRGKLPCDILFVGEAPGQSEDVLGKPFIGNAGALLDELVEQAIYDAELDPDDVRLAYTNLIACIPLDQDLKTGVKTHEPPQDSIEACKPRLQEFVNIAKPKAIVMVGKYSQKWAPKMIDWDFEHSIDIIHPAALLRLDPSQGPLAIQRTTIVLRDFFTQVYS